MSEPPTTPPPADDNEDVEPQEDEDAIEVDEDDEEGGEAAAAADEEEAPAAAENEAAAAAAVPDAESALKGRDLHPIFRLWEDTHSISGFDPVPILTRYDRMLCSCVHNFAQHVRVND